MIPPPGTESIRLPGVAAKRLEGGMVLIRRVVGAEWRCGDEMRQDKAKGLSRKVFIGRCELSNYMK